MKRSTERGCTVQEREQRGTDPMGMLFRELRE